MNLDSEGRGEIAGLSDDMLLKVPENFVHNITNKEVCRKIQATIEEYDELLTMIRNEN